MVIASSAPAVGNPLWAIVPSALPIAISAPVLVTESSRAVPIHLPVRVNAQAPAFLVHSQPIYLTMNSLADFVFVYVKVSMGNAVFVSPGASSVPAGNPKVLVTPASGGSSTDPLAAYPR